MRILLRNLLAAALSLLVWTVLIVSMVYFPHASFKFLDSLGWTLILGTYAGFVWSNWLLLPAQRPVLAIPARLAVALLITLPWLRVAVTLGGKLFRALGGRFFY